MNWPALHATHAAARGLAGCTRADVGFGGVCRRCGYEFADRRDESGPVPTVAQIFDKLAAAGVEIIINGNGRQA